MTIESIDAVFGCPGGDVIPSQGDDDGDDTGPERLFFVSDLPSDTLTHRMAETSLSYTERQILQMCVTFAEALAFLHRKGETL